MSLDRLGLALLAVVAAPLLTAGYIVVADRLAGRLPAATQGRVRPLLWTLPAGVFLAFFLVYPSLNTIYLSLLDATSSRFVGLENYGFLFQDPVMLVTLRNNAIWLVVFTAASVALGLLAAVLTDQVRYERGAKAAIFLPMAISFVAAGVIWRFMYDFRPAGAPQTGTLNAVLTALVPGFEPQAWLIHEPWNNLAIIAAGVWTWTGFCMVILSAALKGIPADLLEAARVDGATEWQIFRRVVLPLISPTIAVVATTMVIFALKAFDLVYVMTNGNYNTDVVANRMYKELFNFHNFGRASALAVLLLVAIVPVMVLNIRRFQFQESVR